MTALPQAIITVDVGGSSVVRRGGWDDLIGQRSINEILSSVIGAGGHAAMQSHTNRSDAHQVSNADEITEMIAAGCRVLVLHKNANDSTAQREATLVDSPSDQMGRDLATWVKADDESLPCYSLHLVIDPVAPHTLDRGAYQDRVDLLKGELMPKIEALDFSGLFRGSAREKGEVAYSRSSVGGEAGEENSQG